MGYRIVVVGATGNVGREMLNILDERQFPVDAIEVLASRRSLGTECMLGDKTMKTKDLDTFDFSGWDIALFAVGSDATKKYAPIAAAAGCVVIDNSSLYRYDPKVPLIVPECNPDAIEGYSQKNIIANPNCSTAQLVVALKPLHDLLSIERVVVSTYQSVSGAGKDPMNELTNQTKQFLKMTCVPIIRSFNQPQIVSACCFDTARIIPVPMLKVRYISRVSTPPTSCNHSNSG